MNKRTARDAVEYFAYIAVLTVIVGGFVLFVTIALGNPKGHA